MASSIMGAAMPGHEFDQTRAHIDDQLVLYVNCVGACERIYKSPVPHAFSVGSLSYTVSVIRKRVPDLAHTLSKVMAPGCIQCIVMHASYHDSCYVYKPRIRSVLLTQLGMTMSMDCFNRCRTFQSKLVSNGIQVQAPLCI